mmetsp:Transcript_33418/g.50409  ORF Transcript_33418/g.50409 Transcript_33418/m.50409 type:complete len:656 (+) Transcript_33418:132-2099(+)|eukprot:CAMPEP_0178926626 /NCGR_PEP_ID=MMETSP0786-20121207/18657_1 /TAXON_ID=186022 /ORGANISM="Thalassionema frauenfeldii, Strain CCMP 1798" /LENGTH=655 /DNA_ID=CAMNT_0020601809 /DNA_START=56 /DNA_END=2023 /DNA_ORIENTATION=-
MCRKPSSDELKQTSSSTSVTAEGSKGRYGVRAKLDMSSDSYLALAFFLPLLFWKITPIMPLYTIAFARLITTHLTMALHYIFVDKDNYNNKLEQTQLRRERKDYLVGPVIHMWTQIPLQIIFPGMFFTSNTLIKACAINTFLSHIIAVEPLYYFAHRWLHIPTQMKKMHAHHHLSINTLPSTSLVQNFFEHFVYIGTFGPAFLLPFFAAGYQHWTVIGAYLVIFDLVNAFGHMNIRIRSSIFTSKWSPLTYLFYTPEFHLGHHAYFRANYALFMPFWDLLLGSYREYKKPDQNLLPPKQQDFVFIGHCGGLGHLLTCPEVSVYNVYDKWIRSPLPLSIEFLLVHLCNLVYGLFAKYYSVSRYLINGSKIGRIIVILKSPIDYIYPKRHKAVNTEIVKLIKDQNKECGTRYFGLGNLNKMKKLNDGGKQISEMVKADPELRGKNIRVWTGDHMTAASIYNQILEIPDCKEIFYIGANGKIGTAVCSLLAKNRPDMKIRILSSYEKMDHPRISYTTDLNEIVQYKYVIVGKLLSGTRYSQAFKNAKQNAITNNTRFLLDYTVPFLPISTKKYFPEIKHIPIGLLQVNGSSFLRGHFDVCMSHDQDHIYPCHAGCVMYAHEGRETDETGDLNLEEIEKRWGKALGYGFQNTFIDYRCK